MGVRGGERDGDADRGADALGKDEGFWIEVSLCSPCFGNKASWSRRGDFLDCRSYFECHLHCTRSLPVLVKR